MDRERELVQQIEVYRQMLKRANQSERERIAEIERLLKERNSATRQEPETLQEAALEHLEDARKKGKIPPVMWTHPGPTIALQPPPTETTPIIPVSPPKPTDKRRKETKEGEERMQEVIDLLRKQGMTGTGNDKE